MKWFLKIKNNPNIKYLYWMVFGAIVSEMIGIFGIIFIFVSYIYFSAPIESINST